MLAVVALAAYAILSAALALLVTVLWHLGLCGRRFVSHEVFALRLLPGPGAAVLVVTIVLPAFVRYEPSVRGEVGGPLLWSFAALSCLMLVDALRRAYQANRATHAFLEHCGSAHSNGAIEFVDLAEPLVAVVGAWRQRIIVARAVVMACTVEEFAHVRAHESAHLAARDNLKALLLRLSPDLFAWLPSGAELIRRWRICAECEADQAAAGDRPERRVVLAAALVRIARLSINVGLCDDFPGTSAARDDVNTRVRLLLAPARPLRKTLSVARLVVLALALTVAALPAYPEIYGLVERLVRAGS